MLYQLSYLGAEARQRRAFVQSAAVIEGRFGPVQNGGIPRRAEACGDPLRTGVPYSALIPADLISGPHLSISDFRNARSSSGDEPIVLTPS